MHDEIKLEDIKDDAVACKIKSMWKRAKSTHDLRTAGHGLLAKISHNQSLFEKNRDDVFSEGSTQAIKRKVRAQTIQRVPDGEVCTQFDKNSKEHVITEFLFKNKVLTSEFDGHDMLKNLWRTFSAAYDYGNGAVRTGFEKDLDGDYRVTYTQIHYNDIYPAPDCDFIEEAEWYIVREWISRTDLEAVYDKEADTVKDPTFEPDVVKYLIQKETSNGIDPKSAPLADKEKGSLKHESIEVLTLYRRGDSEFTTIVPICNAVLRRVKNYDPRKDVPIHFMILEPDPEFPLGCPSVMFTLGQQQFADAFQTSAYQTLLLATQPPIMGFGNLTPSKIKMRPKAFWPMGTNPNNKIEPFRVETTTITQYASILENVSANMMKNMNVTDATVASDAHVMNYSGTPQGVEQQRQDKTITINQYQKRVESFFSEWANHALRSYINSMSGEHEMTVDEITRRKIWDIEMSRNAPDDPMDEMTEESIINGDKITVDFSKLSTDMLAFTVRVGSLIESEKEQERRSIQEMLVPVSQMLGNLSEGNREPFEENIMQMVQRLLELSDVDISQQTADRVGDKLMDLALQATMEKVQQQEQQIMQLQQQMMPEQAMPQEGMPQDGMMPEEQAMMPAEQPPMAPEEGVEPAQEAQPMFAS